MFEVPVSMFTELVIAWPFQFPELCQHHPQAHTLFCLPTPKSLVCWRTARSVLKCTNCHPSHGQPAVQ